MSDGPPNESPRFAWLVCLGWLLLTVPRLLLHELWRDEAWLWLVVRDSRTLFDLFQPLARSGQGYLFPILCFLAGQLSDSPRALQFVHLLVGGAAAFTFARWAPFSRRERVLFLAGYFPFYEYAVISRHYVLGALLVWLACAASRLRFGTIVFGAALGLLCQTTVYGYILAIALACGWLLDRWLRRSDVEPIGPAEAVTGAALAIAGAAAGLVQLIPSAGTNFASGWRMAWDPAIAVNVLRMPWRAFVPLSHLRVNFWNSNLLDARPNLEAVAGVSMLLLTAWFLWTWRVAFATFFIGAAGLLGFGYIKLIGEMRHGGHWWLLFVAALWLAAGVRRGDDDGQSWRSRLLLVLLVVHCVAAAFASWIDLNHPFSNASPIAGLLRSKGLDQLPLLGHREPPAATVALALGQPLYSPSRKLFARYPDWGPHQRELSDHDVRCVARGLARVQQQDIVLVMNREIVGWPELDAIGSRRGAIVRTEDYFVYRLRIDRLDGTDAAAGC